MDHHTAGVNGGVHKPKNPQKHPPPPRRGFCGFFFSPRAPPHESAPLSEQNFPPSTPPPRTIKTKRFHSAGGVLESSPSCFPSGIPPPASSTGRFFVL